MFTRHRHDPPDKLNCPHAMGTDAFSPQWAESFRHFLLLPSPSVLYHGGKPTNLRVGLDRVPRSFRLDVYGYVVMLEHVHLLLREPQQGTVPLKPKPGLSGPPVRVGHPASRLPAMIGIHLFGRRRGAIQTLKLPAFVGGLRRREGHLFFDALSVLSS